MNNDKRDEKSSFSLHCFDTVGPVFAGQQEGHPVCKKKGVGLLVVIF